MSNIPLDAPRQAAPPTGAKAGKSNKNAVTIGHATAAAALRDFLGWFDDPKTPGFRNMFLAELDHAFTGIAFPQLGPRAADAKFTLETLSRVNILSALSVFMVEDDRTLLPNRPHNLFFQIGNLATIYARLPHVDTNARHLAHAPGGQDVFAGKREKREDLKRLAESRDQVIGLSIAAAQTCLLGFIARQEALAADPKSIDTTCFVTGHNIPPAREPGAKRSAALWSRAEILTRCHLDLEMEKTIGRLSTRHCEVTGGTVAPDTGAAFLISFAPSQPRNRQAPFLWPTGLHMVKRAAAYHCSLLATEDAGELYRRSTRYPLQGNIWTRWRLRNSGLV